MATVFVFAFLGAGSSIEGIVVACVAEELVLPAPWVSALSLPSVVSVDVTAPDDVEFAVGLGLSVTVNRATVWTTVRVTVAYAAVPDVVTG